MEKDDGAEGGGAGLRLGVLRLRLGSPEDQGAALLPERGPSELKKVTWPSLAGGALHHHRGGGHHLLLRLLPLGARPGLLRGPVPLPEEVARGDNGDVQAVVHRPHLLGLREEGVGEPAPAGQGLRPRRPDRPHRDPDRGGRGDEGGAEGPDRHPLLPRLHPGGDRDRGGRRTGRRSPTPPGTS